MAGIQNPVPMSVGLQRLSLQNYIDSMENNVEVYIDHNVQPLVAEALITEYSRSVANFLRFIEIGTPILPVAGNTATLKSAPSPGIRVFASPYDAVDAIDRKAFDTNFLTLTFAKKDTPTTYTILSPDDRVLFVVITVTTDDNKAGSLDIKINMAGTDAYIKQYDLPQNSVNKFIAIPVAPSSRAVSSLVSDAGTITADVTLTPDNEKLFATFDTLTIAATNIQLEATQCKVNVEVITATRAGFNRLFS